MQKPVCTEALKNLNKALNELAEAQKSDTATSDHLNVVTMDIWAEGRYPKSILDELLAGPWKKHYDACAGCRQMVEIYRKKRAQNVKD